MRVIAWLPSTQITTQWRVMENQKSLIMEQKSRCHSLHNVPGHHGRILAHLQDLNASMHWQAFRLAALVPYICIRAFGVTDVPYIEDRDGK
eukprot:scaffold500736_cov42-Prasinocladus_malaysianus.AAC.1